MNGNDKIKLALKTLIETKNIIANLKVQQEAIETEITAYLKENDNINVTIGDDKYLSTLAIYYSRRPSWKAEFIKECGQEKAVLVTENSVAKPYETIKIFKNNEEMRWNKLAKEEV